MFYCTPHAEIEFMYHLIWSIIHWDLLSHTAFTRMVVVYFC